MGLIAVVSLDLENGVSSAQRAMFADEMTKLQWTKMPWITTTWKAGFNDGSTESGVVNTTKLEIASCAAKAGITKYRAMVHVGPSKPTEFSS